MTLAMPMRAAEMPVQFNRYKTLCNRHHARTLCYAWASPLRMHAVRGNTGLPTRTSPAAPWGAPLVHTPAPSVFAGGASGAWVWLSISRVTLPAGRFAAAMIAARSAGRFAWLVDEARTSARVMRGEAVVRRRRLRVGVASSVRDRWVSATRANLVCPPSAKAGCGHPVVNERLSVLATSY
jgi:hypothetical protein